MVNGCSIRHAAPSCFSFLRIASGAVLWILILMFSSCSDELGPARPEVLSMSDYLWNERDPDFTYVRSDSSQTVTHALHIENGTMSDTRTDESGGQLSTCTLAYERSSSSARLIGCGPLGLPHIPEHIRFEDQIYSIPGPEVHAGNWVTFDSRTMLVSDVSGTLYRYDLLTRTWEAETVPWTSAVNALARDSSREIARTLCGTTGDGLYVRGDNEATWSRLQAPAGRFEGLAVNSSGTIYALIDGYLYQRSASIMSWEPFPVSSLDDNVTSIAILDLDQTRSMLLFGRRQSVLVHILLVNSMPVQISFPRSQTNENIIGVRCIATSAYPSVAIADPPMLHVSTQPKGTWASVPLPGIARPTAVCQSDYGGTVLIGTEDGLYRFDGTPVHRSGLDGKQVRSLHYGPDRAFYCGTTDGSYRADADGTHWTRIDRSPVLQLSPTGFTLLPSAFSVNSRWDAGSLVVGNKSGRRLSGRIMDHFNEFQLPNGGARFRDVIAVRYAQEDEGGDRLPGEYYWNAFYARDCGPVYFEEAIDGMIQARTSLRKL